MRVTGGGNRAGAGATFSAVLARSCRRLSSLGRNLKGVIRGDGAEEGGLKTMWSCRGELLERRKEASGLILRCCFVRRKED